MSRLPIPTPAAIPRERLERPGALLPARNEYAAAVILFYDPTTSAGGVFHVDGNVWAVYSPLTLSEFLTTLEDRKIAIPAGVDVSSWLATIEASDAAPH